MARDPDIYQQLVRQWQEARRRDVERGLEMERRRSMIVRYQAARMAQMRPMDYLGLGTTNAAPNDKADARARDLFARFLDSEQRRYLNADMPVLHIGAYGRYFLGASGTMIDAHLVESSRVGGPGRYRMCIGPFCSIEQPLPKYDIFLAQLLWLRHDETGFLSVANAARLRPQD